MGVYVKGMKMPKNCNECEFHSVDDVSFELIHQCLITGVYIDDADLYSFPHDCPLVEVSTPHGRLIDGEEVIVKYDLYAPIAPVVEGDSEHWTNLIHMKHILNAPTVIEAEDK